MEFRNRPKMVVSMTPLLVGIRELLSVKQLTMPSTLKALMKRRKNMTRRKRTRRKSSRRALKHLSVRLKRAKRNLKRSLRRANQGEALVVDLKKHRNHQRLRRNRQKRINHQGEGVAGEPYKMKMRR
jgi:hypothetical protein